jgi:RNA-directed DNA polymerase
MGKNPEVPQRVAILLKRQDGKCRFCDSSFKTGDLMEVDHKEPLSKGGKNTYDNLQLLHRHCHDKKTAQDVFGTIRAKREIKPTAETPKPKNGKTGVCMTKHQNIEEPCEVKVSSTVLKTSGFREGIA